MNRPPLTEEQRALVDQNTAIVEEQVGLMRSRVPGHVDVAELSSSASLGLVFAAQDYDPEKGSAFQTYARVRIRGEMLEAIRKLDWCSRRDRARIKRLGAVQDSLAQVAGREVSRGEVCTHLARSTNDHRRYSFAAELLAPISLDLPVGESKYDSLGNFGVADESIRSAPDEMEKREQLAALVAEIERLPEIQRKVLALYYFEKLRTCEIAEAISRSEARVGQILKKARSTLRRRLNAQHDEQRKIQTVAPVLPFPCGRPSNKRNCKVALGTMRGGTRRHGWAFRSTDSRLDGRSMDARGDDSLAGLPRMDTPPNPGSEGAWFGDEPAADAMRPDMPRDSAWWHDFRAVVIELEVQKAQVRAKDREIARLYNLLRPKPAEAQAVPFVRSSRGVVDPLTLGAIAVVGIVLLMSKPSGGPGKDHWWQFWRPNPIAQSQKTGAELEAEKAKAAADQAKQQEKIDAAKAAQLKLAQEAAIATGSAIAAAQATTAAGKPPVKELETAAAVNKTNTQAMEQAIGAADPARVRELETMVANLNAGVAAGAKALELMQGTLDRTVADKAAAQLELERVKNEHATKIKTLEKKFAAKQTELQAFAGERDAIARRYEQLTFWGKLGGLLFAAVVCYVVFLWLRVRGLTNFGKDAVGMTEALKNMIEQIGGTKAREEAKEMISRDWMTAHDGTAKLVDKIKAQLRL